MAYKPSYRGFHHIRSPAYELWRNSSNKFEFRNEDKYIWLHSSYTAHNYRVEEKRLCPQFHFLPKFFQRDPDHLKLIFNLWFISYLLILGYLLVFVILICQSKFTIFVSVIFLTISLLMIVLKSHLNFFTVFIPYLKYPS